MRRCHHMSQSGNLLVNRLFPCARMFGYVLKSIVSELKVAGGKKLNLQELNRTERFHHLYQSRASWKRQLTCWTAAGIVHRVAQQRLLMKTLLRLRWLTNDLMMFFKALAEGEDGKWHQRKMINAWVLLTFWPQPNRCTLVCMRARVCKSSLSSLWSAGAGSPESHYLNVFLFGSCEIKSKLSKGTWFIEHEIMDIITWDY